MAGIVGRELRDRVETSGRIEAGDVLALRRSCHDDGIVGEAEADAIFDLADRIREPSPEWTAFFVEAMTDFVVRQMLPEGYVDAAKAERLIRRIGADGHLRSETELELLVRIVETARAVPPQLARLALDEVRRAVVAGDGVTRHGRLEPGRITIGEVALLRRVLHAAGGERGTAVSRDEAEALFAIDAAMGEAGSVPEWATLFARAVGNHLMAAALHDLPTREEALDRHRWLESSAPGSGFLDRLVDGLTRFGNLIDGLTTSLGDDVEKTWAERNARNAARLAEAGQVTAGEADWIVERIGANGRISAAEAALVDFLRASPAPLPPSIDAMVARFGRAA